jgi:hypothetical protein
MQLFNYTISFIIVSTIIYLSHSNSTSQQNDNTNLIGQTRKLESAEIYLCTCKSDTNMILATPPSNQTPNNTEYFNVTFPNTTMTKTTIQNATKQNETFQNTTKQNIIIPTNAPSHLRAQMFSPSKTPSP